MKRDVYKRQVKIFPSLHDIPREFRIDKFSGGLSYLVNGEVLTAAQGIEVRSPLMLRQQGAPAPYILGEYADLKDVYKRQRIHWWFFSGFRPCRLKKRRN